MGEPSDKYGILLKNDYLAAIKIYLDALPPNSIIPCEWLLVGSTKRCGRTSVPGDQLCWMHQYCICTGKSISAPCRRCNRGTKTKSHLCMRCGGTRMNEHLKRVEATARQNYKRVMEELVNRKKCL